MAIRIYKPTSAGRRNASVVTNDEVTKSRPEKSLLAPLPKKGGRNNTGRITTRGRGGGAVQCPGRLGHPLRSPARLDLQPMGI